MKWLKTTLEPLLAPSVTKSILYHAKWKKKYEDTCLITIETLKIIKYIGTCVKS